jgi:hypothetical protein
MPGAVCPSIDIGVDERGELVGPWAPKTQVASSPEIPGDTPWGWCRTPGGTLGAKCCCDLKPQATATCIMDFVDKPTTSLTSDWQSYRVENSRLPIIRTSAVPAGRSNFGCALYLSSRIGVGGSPVAGRRPAARFHRASDASRARS